MIFSGLRSINTRHGKTNFMSGSDPCDSVSSVLSSSSLSTTDEDSSDSSIVASSASSEGSSPGPEGDDHDADYGEPVANHSNSTWTCYDEKGHVAQLDTTSFAVVRHKEWIIPSRAKYPVRIGKSPKQFFVYEHCHGKEPKSRRWSTVWNSDGPRVAQSHLISPIPGVCACTDDEWEMASRECKKFSKGWFAEQVKPSLLPLCFSSTTCTQFFCRLPKWATGQSQRPSATKRSNHRTQCKGSNLRNPPAADSEGKGVVRGNHSQFRDSGTGTPTIYSA